MANQETRGGSHEQHVKGFNARQWWLPSTLDVDFTKSDLSSVNQLLVTNPRLIHGILH